MPRSITKTPTRCLLYFAYGANLSPKTLERRQVKPRRILGPAVLKEHKLVFNHRGGFGNVVVDTRETTRTTTVSEEYAVEETTSERPDEVHGVVYDLSDSDWEKLKRAEGGYCQADVEVVVYGDDEALLASTFVSNWGSSAIGDPDSFYPTKRYLGLIKEGAKVHQLDKEYQKWLQDLQTVSQMDATYRDTRRARLTKAAFIGIPLLLISLFIGREL